MFFSFGNTQGDSLRQRHGEASHVPVPHHLFMNLKNSSNTIGEDMDIFFSLYDLREGKHIRWGELKNIWYSLLTAYDLLRDRVGV